MTDPPLSLRPAAADDCELVWQWANDPETRANSIRVERISWQEHVAWYDRMLAASDRELLIGERQGVSVGNLRLDWLDTSTVEVSITVAPDHRGSGVGRRLLQAVLDRLGVQSPGTTVVALVRRHNEPSLRLFRTLGFEPSELTHRGGSDVMALERTVP